MGQAPQPRKPFQILSLDGGGAKGLYTLGILREVEALLGTPLSNHFDLIYGTSTGAIIAALLALGYRVDRIIELYRELVPRIMAPWLAEHRSTRLRAEADQLFENKTLGDCQTAIGIVASNWDDERPLIFKASPIQAHGREKTFTPGFGNRISDAVVASCAAFPFFQKVAVKSHNNAIVTAWDGGFVANNPTLFAIADAVEAFRIERPNIRVLSLGCGSYQTPFRFVFWLLGRFKPRHFLKLLNTSSNTIEQLRSILFRDVDCVRISDGYSERQYATDLLEKRPERLTTLLKLGSESFAKREFEIRRLFDHDTLRTIAQPPV